MDLLERPLTTDSRSRCSRTAASQRTARCRSTSFRTVDKAQKEDFIKWDLLRADGFSYDGRDRPTSHQDAHDPRGLCAHDHRQDETLNIAEIFNPEKPAPGLWASVQ